MISEREREIRGLSSIFGAARKYGSGWIGQVILIGGKCSATLTVKLNYAPNKNSSFFLLHIWYHITELFVLRKVTWSHEGWGRSEKFLGWHPVCCWWIFLTKWSKHDNTDGRIGCIARRTVGKNLIWSHSKRMSWSVYGLFSWPSYIYRLMIIIIISYLKP